MRWFFRFLSSQALLPFHVSMIHEVQIVSFQVSPAAPSTLQVHREHMTSEIHEFSSAFVGAEFEWYQQAHGSGSWQLRFPLNHLLQPLSIQDIYWCCSDPAALISTIQTSPWVMCIVLWLPPCFLCLLSIWNLQAPSSREGEVFVSISRYSRDETKAVTRTLQLARGPTESKGILAEILISALREDLSLYFVRLEKTLCFFNIFLMALKKKGFIL